MVLRRFLLASMVVLALVFAAGCASGAPDGTQSPVTTIATTTTDANTAPASLSLSIKDDGGSFEIRAGGTITLALPANPSTGYAWEMDEADPETSLLEQLGEPSFVSDNPDDTGAAGTITYTLRAADPGEMVVRFVYLAPDATGEPGKTFEIHLTVR
jgi:inhibitor of cysteine peptidase